MDLNVSASRRTLRNDLIEIGVRPGDLLMAHASIRNVGAIIGGVNVLVQALFDATGSEGTLAAYVDFEPFYEDDADPDDIPVFDKRTAHAARDHGVLHETLRNWPGVVRSDHPDAGVIAVGPAAEWITEDHPFQYGYGPGSPFDKIVQANGRVLMIGAPLDTITMLHYTEHLAEIPGKRIRRYRRLMPGASGGVWTDFEEFDTADPVCDYLPADCFELIARDYITSGGGRHGRIGQAESYLFEAPALVRFGVEWLERFASKARDKLVS